MLQGAERGEVLTQYEGGAEGRQADIEAGAGRSADEIVADVRESNDRLEQTWVATTEKGWLGRGIALRGELPNVALPYRRWVESEVHHIDLGVLTGDEGDTGYTLDDLPGEFVGLELRRLTASWASRQPMGLTDLPEAALRLIASDRLGWLLGRLNVDGLGPAGVFG